MEGACGHVDLVASHVSMASVISQELADRFRTKLGSMLRYLSGP